MASTATPARGAERHELLDALRGFALFAVLLVNLRDFSLYAFLNEPQRAQLPTATIDRWLEPLFMIFVDAKAATLFSLLFGVGFAMQTGAGRDGGRRYRRRLLILFLIGCLHAYLLWWGDILRYYALLGLLLLPLAGWSARALATAGVVVALFAWPLLLPVMKAVLPPLPTGAEARQAALVAFGSDRLGELWQVNLAFDLRMRLANWSLVFFVLGRLLIGAAIGRSQALIAPERHPRWWAHGVRIALPLGFALTAFSVLRDGRWLFADGWWAGDAGRNLARVLRSAAPLLLGLGYLAAFVRLYRKPWWHAGLRRFAPVGRMALTHYLAQTLVGVALFYGIGLDIGARLGLVGTVPLALAIFAAQMAFSRFWLARFEFGPVEWLWRSGVAGAWAPLRRRASRT